ncbi:MAG: ABC transporter ATP-binding protein [Clostridia bacterium]|nr:ABC transporter ATP-binding protein [Clostridia bacterium]
MNLLEIKNARKSFDGKKIIDGVSLTVTRGKIVGLLGKNGSGKSTLIKLINDLLTLDDGEILVNGEKIGVNSKAVISYLPERSYLDVSKKVSEIFDYFEDFYKDFDRDKAESLVKELELSLDMKISKMSKGMREKISLALVMSRRAELYILDEPLGGVDPVTRDRILKTILSNFGENSSLIITTHLISDVEKILDEVIFIDKGKIVLQGDADKLREEENASINDIFRRKVQ